MFIFLLAFCFLLLPSRTMAASDDKMAGIIQGNHITADTMSYSGGKYYFKGDVQMARDDMNGGADYAVYDETTGDMHLVGNVYLVDPEIVINAKEAFLNVNSKTGTIYDASLFLRKRNFYVKSPKIEKTGPGTYLLRKAVFTACDSPHPAWSIAGGKTKVVVEKTVWIRNAEIKIGPVPVLYTPFFLSPISTRRASGLLAPNAGYSSFGGLFLEVPYYWAISNNEDATFTLDYYSSRAFGGSVEGRYLEPGGFTGSDKLTFLRDWQDNIDYLYLRGANIGPDFFLNLDFSNRRDFNKLYDFNFQDRERRFLESKGEGFQDFPGLGKAFLRARWFQDELAGVPQSSVIQEVPEAGFYFYPRNVGPKLLDRTLVFDMQTAADNFWRQEGQTAIRLNTAPRLSYVLGNQVNFFQSAGMGFRHYDFSGPGQEIDRLVFDYDAAVRTRLQKAYANGVTHYVEPTLEFIYRDLSGQPPPLVLDQTELLDKSEVLQAQVINRLYDKNGEFLDTRLSDQYDTIAGRLQPISLSVSASRPVVISGTISYDPYTMKVETVDVDSNFSPVKSVRLFVRERFAREQNSWLHNIDSEVDVSPSVTLVNGGWYDAKVGLQELHSELHYKSQCWGIDLVFSKTPGNTAFYFRLRLLGIGRSV